MMKFIVLLILIGMFSVSGCGSISAPVSIEPEGIETILTENIEVETIEVEEIVIEPIVTYEIVTRTWDDV